MPDIQPMGLGRIAVAVMTWLLLAFVAGGSGLLRSVRPPVPLILILSLTAVVLLVFWQSSRFHAWALNVDIRALVLIHASRFVGIYFLILYARGELPYAFAVPGGIGDIGVAAAAVPVSLFWRTRWTAARRALFAWNVCGLIDILLVVAMAARLGMADPESMGALLTLPLSLLPTFLVPIIISTHIIIFARLRANPGSAAGVSDPR